jgi:hypothetical protein
MQNEDRFWEASIAEAVTGHEPPDLSFEILSRLNTAAPRPRVWRYVVEFAAAAVVALAIGLFTGLIPLPGSDTEPEPDPAALWASAPGSRVAETPEGLELEAGWLLLRPGAPDVRRGAGSLSRIEGVALVRAGEPPTEEEFSEITVWLHHNGLEEDMWKAKQWATGLTLAVLMLSGTAVLDGQQVEAPEGEPAAAPEWHAVRSIMDIDNLPKGVTHVNADGVSCEILAFLVEIPTLQGISLREGQDLRVEHLESLTVLQNLSYLDLRGAEWTTDVDRIDYKPILELPNLKTVGLDPDNPWQLLDDVMPELSALSERGIEILLGEFDFGGSRFVESEGLKGMFLEHVPQLKTVTALHLANADNDVLQAVSHLESVTSLTLEALQANEFGIAHLGRRARLEHLAILDPIAEGHLPLEWFHHIARIETLKELHLRGPIRGDARASLEMLARLPNLTTLGLYNTRIDSGQGDTWQPVLDALPRLEALHVTGPGTFSNLVQLYQELPHVHARRVEITMTDNRSSPGGSFPVTEGDGQVEHIVFAAPFTGSADGPGDSWIAPEDVIGRVRDGHSVLSGHGVRLHVDLSSVFRACKHLQTVEIRTPRDAPSADVRKLIQRAQELAPEGVEVIHTTR